MFLCQDNEFVPLHPPYVIELLFLLLLSSSVSLYDQFKSIDFIIFMKLKLFYFWLVGVSSVWLLSFFEIALVVIDDFLAITLDEEFQAHLVYFLPLTCN